MNDDQGAVLPEYDEVADSLYWLTDGYTVSYIHGMLCARVCINQPFVSQGWVEQQVAHRVGARLLEVATDAASKQRAQSILTRLFDISRVQLQSHGFDFELLMPDDDAAVDLRALALGDWCDGFCGAFEAADVVVNHYSEDVRESLSYLAEVIDVDLSDMTEGEEAEKALMDVSEYIRMAIILIFIESQDMMTLAPSCQVH